MGSAKGLCSLLALAGTTDWGRMTIVHRYLSAVSRLEEEVLIAQKSALAELGKQAVAIEMEAIVLVATG